MDNLTMEAQRFGEMLEPIAVFAEDEELREVFKERKVIRAAALIFKKHPSEAVDFILAYEGTDRENADLNRKNLLPKLIKILSDKDVLSAFTSAE